MFGRVRAQGDPRQGTGSPTILRSGGFTFAERPEVAAPEARIIWRADLDPGALGVIAMPVAVDTPDSIDPVLLSRWLTLATDPDGREHAVLSDGWHHIRLDIEQGSLAAGTPVVLQYLLQGIQTAEPRILPLRRLLHLCRHRRFAISLFPADKAVPRGLLLLRVNDALADGASQRDIARALFGQHRIDARATTASDSLRSRVRRMVAEARAMAGGGYRALLRRR